MIDDFSENLRIPETYMSNSEYKNSVQNLGIVPRLPHQLRTNYLVENTNCRSSWKTSAMYPFSWILLATLVVLAGHADVAVAPFPPEHAYHWLNPWIEPW